MKYSLNLIRKFIETDLSDADIIDAVSRQIAEVESVTDFGQAYEKLVVAEIKKAEQHPDADKLGLYVVDTGKNQVQVVAGDKTLKPGDQVIYIPPGAIVPETYFGEQFTIKKAELRGEESNGMLASLKELNISDEHSGVFRFSGYKIGKDAKQLFDLDDRVIEIENKSITHRPDLFGHLGMAREIAGVLKVGFKSPDNFMNSSLQTSEETKLGLSVESSHVNRFTLMLIEGVNIGKSSTQRQAYLNKLGVRPINSVVDLTNWAWIVYAQPMHAFDFDKLKKIEPSGQVNVFDAKGGEELTLIDDRSVKMAGGEILISAGNQPISLAGAMGGKSTEVDENSKNIIFEAASFDMYKTRQTSMQHGVFTDAVTIFSRGQDSHKPALIQSIIASELDISPSAFIDHGTAEQSRKISLSAEKVSRLLGKEFTAIQVAGLLNNVEIASTVNDEIIVSEPPFWRKDLNIDEDIVEEVGRLYGFDELGFSLPKRDLRAVKSNSMIKLKESLRKLMSSHGANEILSYNFVSSSLLKKANFGHDDLYRIKNALSPELEYMRASLIPGLLEKTQYNYKQQFDNFVLFEVGKTHSKKYVEADLPIEQDRLAFTVIAPDAFFLAKRYLNRIEKELGVVFTLQRISDDKDYLHQGRSAHLYLDGELIGEVGEITMSVKNKFKLNSEVAVLEVDLNKLAEMRGKNTYQPLSEFPSSIKDMTVRLNDKFSYEKLYSELKNFLDEKTINSQIECKSIYRSNEMKDSRNITFRLDLFSYKRTLTNKEITKVFEDFAVVLLEQFNAEIV